jgi:hypothetical protein
VPAELRCFPGVTPVFPGRAKDEADKAILSGLSQTTPVIINILLHPGSNAGCSRIIPDVAGRVTYVLRLFPVAPRSFPDHPGRLPGLCRDVSENVAITRRVDLQHQWKIVLRISTYCNLSDLTNTRKIWPFPSNNFDNLLSVFHASFQKHFDVILSNKCHIDTRLISKYKKREKEVISWLSVLMVKIACSQSVHVLMSCFKYIVLLKVIISVAEMTRNKDAKNNI